VRTHLRRAHILVTVAALLALAAPQVAPTAAGAHADPGPATRHRPVIFVHGAAGSAQQFESQAQRFASNGYPADIIEGHEYDSPSIATILDQVWAGLDQRIDRLLASTGADRVDLLGHSLGTFVMQGYLASSPARAAKVAHYVNLDGRPAAAPPGGVPTLAVWGEGDPARTIVGATNVTFPGQAHTQVVTSPETFTEVYRFFTGRAPRTTRIVPQPPGRTNLSGRVVLFPSNVGVSAARLEVYQVSTLTGRRRHARPDAVLPLSADGSFGPWRASGTARYEFALVRAGAATHHFYFQPFRRTDRLIRLLAGVPGEGLGALVETSDRHTALTVSRNKEWWGDQGAGNDALWVNGVNVLNAANAPRAKRVIGIFAYDRFVDGESDLSAPIPVFFAQPFITGMDVFVPAAPAHRGLVSVLTRPRGGGVDLLTVPNWPSSEHRITIHVPDYVR
jgi:hypothetical protein